MWIFLKSKWALIIIIQGQVCCCHRQWRRTVLSTDVPVSLCLHQIPYGLPYFWFSRCIGYLCRTATSIRTVRSVLKRGIRTAAGVWERAGECCRRFPRCRQWNSSNFDVCCGLLLGIAIPAFRTQPYAPDSDLILSHGHWYPSSVHTNKSRLTCADLITLGKCILFCWYWKSLYIF